MPIIHVRQLHENGCFIACLAMLLGKTYDEIFRLVLPKNNPNDFKSPGVIGTDIRKVAMETMQGLGIQVRPSKYRKLKSLVKYARKHALFIIRWKWDLTLCHAVLFDAETKRFLDPSGKVVANDNPRYNGGQVECIMWVSPPKAA